MDSYEIWSWVLFLVAFIGVMSAEYYFRKQGKHK